MGALDVPSGLQPLLDEIDDFIRAEIFPLQNADDNVRFFDHRREWARTDFEKGGIPRQDWVDLLDEARKRSDDAGWYRLMLPPELGGRSATNMEMTVIREHLASRGLGLHNDLQDENSVVGNLSEILLVHRFGSDEQKHALMDGLLDGSLTLAFALTEPGHGSDATHLDTTAVKTTSGWRIDGAKRWISRMDRGTHCLVFARTSGSPGDADGITTFLVPVGTPGLRVDFFWWTFNMPTHHAEMTLAGIEVPDSAIFGELGKGLEIAQTFVHEQRIRQAAASLGAGQYCVDEAVAYANDRIAFGRPLSRNQGIQFPLVEIHTELAMLRQLIRFTAARLDENHHMAVSHYVAMCNYRANRACTEAADRAMQTCGGVGYSRHMPFEHIYRHHRRYRITEGAEEIQMRRVAQRLFAIRSSRGSAS